MEDVTKISRTLLVAFNYLTDDQHVYFCLPKNHSYQTQMSERRVISIKYQPIYFGKILQSKLLY